MLQFFSNYMFVKCGDCCIS